MLKSKWALIAFNMLLGVMFLMACPLVAPVQAAAAKVGDLVVIVVRHAEKAESINRDPSLSAAGQRRAEALAEVLADAHLNAIYTTQLARTMETAAPLAQRAGVDPVIRPIASGEAEVHSAALAEHIVANHVGETVVVVGHSNTVPLIIRALGGPDIGEIREHEYHHLFTLVISSERVRLVRARYGNPSSEARASERRRPSD